MSSNLPPLRNLPSWSRVRDLDRVRYPRLLSSDCKVRPPSVNLRSSNAAAAAAAPCVDVQGRRIASLEKDIVFLQEQHKDTLERLHAEIEDLKRSNKELQYQLVMKHQHSPRVSCAYQTDSVWPNNFSKCSDAPSAEDGSQCRLISSQEMWKEATGPDGGAAASLLPLRMSCGPSQRPRTPTLTECEVIIRQLCHANSSQYQELMRVRRVLRDVVLSRKKSHAEAISLAKACLHDNTRGNVFQHFPKLSFRPLPTKQHPRQTNREETVEKLLPPIKRNLSSTMSERQQKAQDVHKMRLRRAVNS